MEPLLSLRGVKKSYRAPVLVDFDFEVAAGEVHALMGANGAGKSTLARIISGFATADEGTMTLGGLTHAPASKQAGEAAGVVMVLQELNLIPTLSVAENLFLDRLPQRWGLVQRTQLERQAREALARLGLEKIDPWTPAGTLGVGQQQLIEIARALTRDARLLILDEPTAALTDKEIESLFDNIRRLQKDGVGIIYISHRMDEIRRLADRVTVMRDGYRVGQHAAHEITPEEIVREMSGVEMPTRAARATSSMTNREVALQVDNLHCGALVQAVSLRVHRGEIVGLAGLIGSGRTETLRAIFGADRATSGSVSVGGKTATLFHEPAEAVAAGLGLVPEDRKREGLLLSQSIRVNTTLNTLKKHATLFFLRRGAETSATTKAAAQLAVKYQDTEQTVQELSGGNQQKIVMARWFECGSDVLLCDEPTRGVDAAAKDLIQRQLRAWAEAGHGVLVVSSELPELMALCDRILVMSAGRLCAEFTPDTWSQEKINAAAFSGHFQKNTTTAA
jgi:ribose transport system ATP-binding protein